MAHIQAMTRFLLELGKLAVQARRWPDDYLFVRAVYRACLKREPDADGEAFYLAALRRGSMSKLDVLRSVLESNEFKQFYGFPVHPLNALYQARMMLVWQHLPMARVIVDLGGAAEDHPEGALLVMGYPYHPSEIIIVDPVLPRPLRGHGKDPEWIALDGVRIRYHQGSMTDLSWVPDQSVDLVFAGESVEHISENEAWTVCAEVFRILKPGGYFCLDTPNAALTRLQSPKSLIHPGHKKEYTVQEIKEMLERTDFVILQALGICPMPESLRRKVFDPTELIHNIQLSENPEKGYLFFIKAIKPYISLEEAVV